jgi:ribosome-binding factor A
MLYKSILQTRQAAMTTVNHRHERIGEEIAHEINAMLAGELKDPRLEMSVVVNQVLIAHDMRHARVLVGVRHEILERLQLRRVPDLHFSLDNSQEYTERIDQLLKELKKDSPSTT